MLSISEHFVDWEMELILAESLVLSGTSQMAFRYLAFAWGREEDFHSAIVQAQCQKKNGIPKATPTVLGSESGSVAGHPHQAKRVHHRPYHPEVPAPISEAHDIHDTTVSACTVTDEDDTSRESGSSPVPYPSGRGMERNEQYASNLSDPATCDSSLFSPETPVPYRKRRTSSLTFDCEDWKSAFLSHFEVLTADNSDIPPHCCSPLHLDETLLNEMYQGEGM